MRQDDTNRGDNKPKSRKERGHYANFFQIAHTVAEFLIEFGQEDGSIHTRVYLSPQHARILSDLLLETLRRHEQAFGPINAPDRGFDRTKQ
jgi:hypothetical protein